MLWSDSDSRDRGWHLGGWASQRREPSAFENSGTEVSQLD